MSKEKRIIISVLALLFALFCFDVWVLFYREEPEDPNIKYDIYGEGKYAHFGDGRFQVMYWGPVKLNPSLIDFFFSESPDFFLAEEVKKYILIQDSLAVVGSFGGRTVDTTTGEGIYFDENKPEPNYLILNIKTGEVKYFVSLEQMTQEEQALFNKELDDECLKARTCYQEGVNPSRELILRSLNR